MFWIKFLICLVVLSPLLIAGYNTWKKPQNPESYVNASYYCVENFVYVKIDKGLAPMFNDMGRPLSCREWKENKKK